MIYFEEGYFLWKSKELYAKVVWDQQCPMEAGQWCLGQNEIGILQGTGWAREINGQEVDERSNADVGLEWSNLSAGES